MDKFKSEKINKSAENLRESYFSNDIKYQEFSLDNGLDCVLYQDNKNPIINVTLGYKVGSKDEAKDKKGTAHLFEHLMFQGSENIPKDQHFNLIQKAGGVCNAFTMQDATVYFDVVPSNQLETVLWLESDRMRSLDLHKKNLDTQKKVVLEEKMQRYDNAPYGTAFHKIFHKILKGSKYESPVIGYDEDILSLTENEAMDFHRTYYSPKNAVMVMAGDIDIDNAKELVEKYFGDIKNGDVISRMENNVSEYSEDASEIVYDNIHLPAIYIAYQIPGLGTDEEYTLDYFSNIIGNDKSSRLYKKLVYEMQAATSIYAYKYQLQDAGLFVFRAELLAGGNPEEVKNLILNEVNEFMEKGFSDKEYEKIRNEIEFYNTTILSTLQKISLETLFNKMLFSDINLINNKIDRYLSFNKDEIMDVVKKNFDGTSKFAMKYLPKNS